MSQTLNASTLLAVPLAPLAGALLAGIFGTTFGGNWIGRRLSHTLCILGVFVAFVISAMTLKSVALDGARFNADHLRVDGGRRPEDGNRLPRRRPHGHDDVRGDLRVADGPHLHHRLHGRGRRLQPLLRLHLAVHVLDADARDEQQLPAAVLRLGGGGPGVLPADRLLVQQAHRHLRQPEGLPGQPRRRLRLHPGHRPDRRLRRHPELRRGLRQGRRAGQAGLPGHRAGC